ncbi:MAG: PilZ domain-containing protein [Thermodesulfobacteriota bacterium]
MEEKNQKKMTDKAKTKRSPSAHLSQKSKDNSLEILKVTRDSYRVPVDPSYPIQVKIGNRNYDAVNVARKGVGFLVPNSNVFLQDETLKSVMLICQDNKITMEGRVIHISPHEFGKFICGIEFINLDAKAISRLREYLEKCRINLFSK